MKQYLIHLAVAATLCFAACTNADQKNDNTPSQTNATSKADAKAAAKMKCHQDSLSWAVGMNLGKNVKEYGLALNNEMVLAGMQSMLNGNITLDQKAYEQLLGEALQQIVTKQRSQESKAVNSEEEYFAKLVKENPKVKKAEQGFYYEVLKKGKGKNAVFTQRLKIDYKSYFMLTGEPIDQTYGNVSSITTTVGKQLFPGLRYGLMLMNEGSKYRFYFPNQLAFGANGTEDIPPYTPVIYEVEIQELYAD